MQIKDVTSLVEAAGGILWPILAAVLVWKLLPTLATVLREKGWKLKFGDKELSVSDVSHQLNEQVQDLREKVAALMEAARSLPNRETAAVLTAAPDSGRPFRVLWVDDNPVNNVLLSIGIKESGAEIVDARSTVQGMQIMEQSKLPFDVVVSDMGRDEGGSYRGDAGLELLRQIRQTRKDLPVFFFTTQTQAASKRQEVLKHQPAEITSSGAELYRLIQAVMRQAKS